MPTIKTTSRLATLIAAVSFFILFLGCGRILSFVLHNPLLAYANNYEMIPLQACQQIWPADSGVDITRGTVTAPLRHYTLDKHVDTPCIFSSELLFTQLGIEFSKIMPSSQDIISLQTIGLVKALFLILTAIIAQIIFWRLGHNVALLSHALIVLMVLSDPGITLYLSTFYTEFSAVYFLYLTLLGVSLLSIEQRADKSHSLSRWQWLGITLAIVVGIIGFGLSKALHAPLLISLGALLAVYVLVNKPRLLCIPIIIATAMPLLLENMGAITLSNDNMILADKINTTATLLDTANNPRLVLDELGLPDSCLALKGKNWYTPATQKNKTCFELQDISRTRIALLIFSNPTLLSDVVWAGLPRIKDWIVFRYGQVESEASGKVDFYFSSLSGYVKPISDQILLTLLLLPPIFFVVCSVPKLLNKNILPSFSSGLWLLYSLLPAVVFLEALCESGLIDLPKHLHLVIPLTVSVYLVMLVNTGSIIAQKIFTQNHHPG